MVGDGKANGRAKKGQVAESDAGGQATTTNKPSAEVKIPVEGKPAHVHVTAPQDLPQELIDTEDAPLRAPSERAARAGTVQSAAPAPPTEAARASNTLNALIHLYRGELGRMTAYR